MTVRMEGIDDHEPSAPICEQPTRMQPILSTLNQIEQDMRDVLVYEQGDRARKVQRVRNVLAATQFLSMDTRQKTVEELTKSFKEAGKKRSPKLLSPKSNKM